MAHSEDMAGEYRGQANQPSTELQPLPSSTAHGPLDEPSRGQGSTAHGPLLAHGPQSRSIRSSMVFDRRPTAQHCQSVMSDSDRPDSDRPAADHTCRHTWRPVAGPVPHGHGATTEPETAAWRRAPCGQDLVAAPRAQPYAAARGSCSGAGTGAGGRAGRGLVGAGRHSASMLRGTKAAAAAMKSSTCRGHTRKDGTRGWRGHGKKEGAKLRYGGRGQKNRMHLSV